MSKKRAGKIHRYYSRHHSRRAKTDSDFIQMIIDCESARFTKPDKPLNARETFIKYYPELVDRVEPLLIKLDL